MATLAASIDQELGAVTMQNHHLNINRPVMLQLVTLPLIITNRQASFRTDPTFDSTLLALLHAP